MRVLVTGAGGQLGQTIQQHAKNVAETTFVFKHASDLDICNTKLLSATFSDEGPFDFCINCAAYTDVEGAETNESKAYAINAHAVRELAVACNENNTKLIHISTDYVFNGEKTTPYIETDLTDPINVYGASKLLGEVLLKEELKEYFIIRTSWLYSKQFGKNFYRFIQSAIDERRELPIIDNQFGSPTNTEDLAFVIIKIIQYRSEAYGIYHYSSKGITNWHEFALEIVKKVRPENQHYIKAVKEFKTKAKRPSFSKLSEIKIEKTFNLEIPHWADAIK